MTIQELENLMLTDPKRAISALMDKQLNIPPWKGVKGLEREYYPRKHPVYDKSKYPDIVHDNGELECVTRVAFGLQRLATKRMTELMCAIPVKRIYHPANERQSEIAKWMEKIYEKVRINSVNTERLHMLYAGCEVMTLWYAQPVKNNIYGFDSDLKFRCMNYSPMKGHGLYPLFDEYGDMIASSISYKHKVLGKTVSMFDSYTATRHIKYVSDSGSSEWSIPEGGEDDISSIGKIPIIYWWRETPIWEDESDKVFEGEWAMSRNGNYLRKNSKPLFVVIADDDIEFGGEQSQDEEFRSVLQYPKGSSAGYVTWSQAIDNLKYFYSELRESFFSQLQLPDFSYAKMSQQALSGESRKQLFIDSKLKVGDESGPVIEGFDREVNVVKAMMKTTLPDSYHKDVDELWVENIVTAYQENDEMENVKVLTLANGGKPIMTQRESVEHFGWSSDVDKTMEELEKQEERSAFPPYE